MLDPASEDAFCKRLEQWLETYKNVWAIESGSLPDACWNAVADWQQGERASLPSTLFLMDGTLPVAFPSAVDVVRLSRDEMEFLRVLFCTYCFAENFHMILREGVCPSLTHFVAANALDWASFWRMLIGNGGGARRG